MDSKALIAAAETEALEQHQKRLESIEVEVACAVEDLQRVINLQLPAGSSLADAVSASGILEEFSSLDLEKIKFGVYGQLAPAEAKLKDGDRVEVYRPLLISPMEARRLRAKRKKEANR
ncbi:MAG: putative ubiquitin-RnfH superfamily antitoxin RatB of RatAB toxin-antitoxin module [Candidatus Azotimanducaceae bacterium]|jgi:putative ubiquitin-RnfH superfamily antitoxin RatB of RatAB toxin-antitoxin module